MNILLTTLNAKYIHSSLALRYLRAYGRTKGQAYDIVEYTINMPVLSILADITEHRPDVVGFACYIWNIDMTLHVASLIKEVAPKTHIVLGGPEVSYTAETVMAEHPYVDYIVQGEGEEAFTALTQALEDGRTAEDIAIVGVLGRTEDGRLVGSREIAEVADLSTIPFPYDESDMNELTHKIMYYESSRGCPFSCQYCLSGNRNTVRFFPLQRTLQELQWFVDHEVKQIKFVDRTFNCSPYHHIPIMEWIHAADTATNFHLEMEAVLMGDREVELLSTAPKGRMQIEVGVQSTHEPTLAAICRHNDWSHIQSVIRPIIAAGRTHVHMDLIIGLPHEDYERFGQSFDDLFSLQPHALQLGFLKLLRGSGVSRMDAYDYRYDPKAPYEVLATHVLPYENIRFLKHFEDVFERFYNSERLRRTFTYVGQAILQRGESAFRYFEDMTREWLAAGNDKRKLNDRDQLAFLHNFFKKRHDTIAMELLGVDTLYAYKGRLRDEAIGLPPPRKEELKASEAFWRDEASVRRYIPEYSFNEWRRIRHTYAEVTLQQETAKRLGVDSTTPTVTLIIDVEERVAPFVRPEVS
ncbi:B12-binding domain-containing radical SAM protein [Veillonella magna]|uniref:B12-binding domain-containing radical SAM protein n=1 Tax=Veillonella magna TaxID=464322 RepID=UPI0023F31FD3|nr:radical SAM protein [Veillonella magna]